jgi:hypothetical protein
MTILPELSDQSTNLESRGLFHPAYTDVQTLKQRGKPATFCHFSKRLA